MIKMIHLIFVLLSITSFVGRFFLAEKLASLLDPKLLKIGPHIINGILLLTGFILVFQGSWFSTDYGWIIAKLVVLLGYVGLGIVALKSEGDLRWKAFAGAIACFIYIVAVAGSKHALIFF